MFTTLRNLIPEPRQADQPRNYTGRHRRPEPTDAAPAPEPADTEEEAAAAAG